MATRVRQPAGCLRPLSITRRRRVEADALAQYLEALRLKPDLATAHFNIAVLLVGQGKLEDARRHLQTALTIDPGYAAARQALAVIDSR